MQHRHGYGLQGDVQFHGGWWRCDWHMRDRLRHHVLCADAHVRADRRLVGRFRQLLSYAAATTKRQPQSIAPPCQPRLRAHVLLALSPFKPELFCASGNVEYNAVWPSSIAACTTVTGSYCAAGWTGTIGRTCKCTGQWSTSATGGCTRTSWRGAELRCWECGGWLARIACWGGGQRACSEIACARRA